MIETFFLVTVGALSLRPCVASFSIGVYLASLRQVRNGTSSVLSRDQISWLQCRVIFDFHARDAELIVTIARAPGHDPFTIDKRVGEFLIWTAVSGGGLCNLTA